MSFQHLQSRYPSLLEFIDQQKASGLYAKDGTPAFAYNMDRWILTALNSAPVKRALDEAVTGLVDLQFGAMIATAIPITEGSFPEIHDALASCSRTLGITIPYAVGRSDESFFNAYTAGTDGAAFIVVSTGILRFFPDEEIKFVIGHECGHIAAEHMTYKVAVDVLSGAAMPLLGVAGMALQKIAALPLMAWSRRAEVTADRAGLLCSGDLAASERALLRLVGGFADQSKVGVEDFLSQSREIQSQSSFTMVQYLLASHPMIPQRIEALRLFARSELYHRLSGRTPANRAKLIPDVELANRTAALVRP